MPEQRGGELLAVRLQQLMAQLHRRFAGDFMGLMNGTGLTMPQLVALHVLESGSQSINGMADHLKLSVSATSHLVDRLFEKGFVDRREHPDDRRQKRVALTAEGTEFIGRLARLRTEEMTRVLAILDPATQEGMLRIFEAAIAEFGAEPPPSST